MKKPCLIVAVAGLLLLGSATSQPLFNGSARAEPIQDSAEIGREPTTSKSFEPSIELTELTTGSKGTLEASDSIVTTYDGEIVENFYVRGRITVRNKNVTIRNCRITNTEYYAIFAPDDAGYDVSGLVVENSTISGSVNGIAGKGTFRRNNIFQVDNGVNVWGPSEITENYIHDLGSVLSASTGHNDGIENNGSGMTLRRNRIEAGSLDTSAVMTNNEFGSLVNIIIDGNDLSGGQYTIYVDNSKNQSNKVSNFVVINNTIRSGIYGPAALYTSDVVIGPSNRIN